MTVVKWRTGLLGPAEVEVGQGEATSVEQVPVVKEERLSGYWV